MPLTLTTEDTKIYLYDTHIFTATLRDDEDNPIPNEKIVLCVDDVETSIEGITDENGKVDLRMGTFSLGEYKISACSNALRSNEIDVDVIYSFIYDDISDEVSYNFRTLNKDIALFKRQNGAWDLLFDKGDLVSATELHSLQIGIIIACLTSWNYLARYGNPTYVEFGNEAYALLKKNKGINTRYKIEQFFKDCLNRMRRVYRVEYISVNEVYNNPYMYHVFFSVTSISNQLVDGEFIVGDNTGKSSSNITLSYNRPYTSIEDPLNVEINLVGEYGNTLPGEIIHVFVIKNGSMEFLSVTEPTDEYGTTHVTIPPNELTPSMRICFIFKGNTLYNSAISNEIHIESIGYYFRIKPILKTIDGEVQYHYLRDEYKNIVEKNGIPVLDYSKPIIDKEILSVEGFDDAGHVFRLGKIVESLEDYSFEEDREYNLMYVVRENEKYMSYEFDGESVVPIGEDIMMRSIPQNDELHLFVKNNKFDGYFEIDSRDDHLYYITEKWFNLEDWYNYDD